jgi:hypothetical protein
MRTLLLLLLLASSAISSVAQWGITSYPAEDREWVEADLREKFIQKNTGFRTNHFVDLGAVHTEFFKRFAESPGFGSQRIESYDWARPVGELTMNGRSYGVFPPQLIGLENHEAAYYPLHGYTAAKNDFLSKLNRRDIKTRLLTAYETNAVAQLKAGTNIVTGIEPARLLAGGIPKPEQLLVLAPIHAKADCAKCPKCEEGKLLGAFSNAFTRIDPPTNTVKGLAIAAIPRR